MSSQRIAWDDAYLVGWPSIDDQHRYFVQLINDLDALVKAGTPAPHCADVLNEIYYYAFFHFLSEENLMKRSRYGALERQQREHKELLAALTAKMRHFGEGRERLDGVLSFLFGWFVSHTVEEDKPLGAWLRRAAVPG